MFYLWNKKHEGSVAGGGATIQPSAALALPPCVGNTGPVGGRSTP